MDRRILTIVLALALIGCMFLPFLKFFGSGASLFDIVTAKGGGDWEKYVCLLIPISAAMLLIGALNKENYLIARFIWAILPLLTVLYYPVRLYMEASKGGNSVNIGDLIKVFDIGFWALLGVALILAVVQPKSKFA